jgi:hypothetical protein
MVVYRRLHLERLKLLRRLGRRGSILLLMGVAWILVGVTGIGIPIDRFSTPGIGTDVFLQLLDSPEIYFLWIIAGSIAVFTGSLHDRRFINRYEALGWNAVLTPCLLWTIFYAWSFVIWLASSGEGGRSNGLYGFVVWLVISLIIMIMAGWPEEKFETTLNPPPGSTHHSPDNSKETEADRPGE